MKKSGFRKGIFTNSYYWYCYRKKKVVENRILFESFHGSTISDSPLAMLEELAGREDVSKYEIYYSTSNTRIKEHQKLVDAKHLPVKLVIINTFEYNEVLATSHYLINNSSFPTYFIRRPEQIYLQTWHGTPLKTLGKQMRMGLESMHNVQHNFLQANYLMHPNMFTKTVMMRDYNMEDLYTGKVVLSGYPRNSIFLNTKKANEVRKQLGLEDKTIFAYMPTWRGTSNHSVEEDDYSNQVRTMFRYMDDRLLDDQILFVNFHPILKFVVSFEEYKHIRPFPNSVNNYEFLNCTDALITDYSSVFFDYSITRKPIVLFTYDYDEYMRDRGMYFDIRELPFKRVEKIEELTDLLTSGQILKEEYSDPEYYEKYTKYDSLDASGKMLDLVLHGKEKGLECIDYAANKDKKRKLVFAESVINNKGKWTTDQLDTFSKYVIEKCDPAMDVLVLKFEKFSKELSAHFYDNYADKLIFVIENSSLPTSFIEKVKKGLKKENRKQLEQRDLQRSFPGLSENAEIVRNVYLTHIGTDLSKYKFVKKESELVNDSGVLVLTDFPAAKDVRQFLLLNRDYKIVYKTDAFEQKDRELRWKPDLQDDLLVPNSFYMIACEIEIKGKRSLSLLHNPTYDEYDGHNQMKKNLDSFFVVPFETGKQDLVIMPAKNGESGKRCFALKICAKINALDRVMQGRAQWIKSGKTDSEVTFAFRKLPGLDIKGVALRYRSEIIQNEKELEYTIKDQGPYFIITAKIDFKDIDLRELYWDFLVLCTWRGIESEVKVILPQKTWKLVFFFCNIQYRIDNQHIVFPYGATRNALTYMYREISEYDAYKYRVREFLAVMVYYLRKRSLNKKNIWLVFEKFCYRAEDNAYWFFRYCMENLTEEEKKRIYYVIDKRSPDYERIKEYGNQVIDFMSVRHIVYMLASSMLVGADSKAHLFAWRSKTSIVRNKLKNKKIFFLQHGVTAMKRVDPLFGKQGSNPMTYFDCTSQFEQNIVTKYFGYRKSEAPVTGFARWDVLQDKSDQEKKNILVMPTWRSWLEEVSDEEFARSDYYKNYSHLLENEQLHALLKENDIQMNFYIHPKFVGYLKTFHTDHSHIRLIPSGSEPLNELMMKCHALITDYSSVCWDVFYQKKPVIFYHFDLEKYNLTHGSYIDLKTELFGRKADTEKELIAQIKECIESGFKALPEDIEKYHYYFAYQDSDNCKRIYDYLKNISS